MTLQANNKTYFMHTFHVMDQEKVQVPAIVHSTSTSLGLYLGSVLSIPWLGGHNMSHGGWGWG